LRSVILILVLLLNLPDDQAAQNKHSARVILPNPHLLRCKATDCLQLWSRRPEEQNAIFPTQVIVDMNQDCLYGMTATYDKSMSVETLKALVDAEYGNWAVAGSSGHQ